MTTKNKVPKSGKTKLSDLSPRKDARGGKRGAGTGPLGGSGGGQPLTPPIVNNPPYIKKQVNS